MGVTVFEAFLRSEFSEENLQFYSACEQYRQSSNKFSLQRRAKMISETYIQFGAPREVVLSKFGCLFVCLQHKQIFHPTCQSCSFSYNVNKSGLGLLNCKMTKKKKKQPKSTIEIVHMTPSVLKSFSSNVPLYHSSQISFYQV